MGADGSCSCADVCRCWGSCPEDVVAGLLVLFLFFSSATSTTGPSHLPAADLSWQGQNALGTKIDGA